MLAFEGGTSSPNGLCDCWSAGDAGLAFRHRRAGSRCSISSTVTHPARKISFAVTSDITFSIFVRSLAARRSQSSKRTCVH